MHDFSRYARAAALGVVMTVATAATAPQTVPQTGLKKVAASFTTATGTHEYVLEVAATSQQQQTGMMWRTSVPPQTGMYFPFSPPRSSAYFWMKNTLVPLDVIFIGIDGRVIKIIPRSDTGSIKSFGISKKVSGVVEIAFGESAAIGLKVGDRFATFGTPE